MDESNENIVNESESHESESNESNLPDAKILEYFEEGAIAKKESYVKILLMLYELTKIDEELADIDDEKGDLPVRIENLKERMAVVDVHLTEDKAKLKTFESEEKALTKENKNLDDKVTKYDESKYKAKNAGDE